MTEPEQAETPGTNPEPDNFQAVAAQDQSLQAVVNNISTGSNATSPPASEVPGLFQQTSSTGSRPPKRLRKRKIWVISIAALLLLAAGGAVFGWYLPNTPDNAYNTAMNRTGEALDSLVTTATSKQKLASYETTAVTGTAKATFGKESLDGTFHSTFDKMSSDDGMDVTLKGSDGQTQQLSLKALTQVASGKLYPDVYLQFSGLQSFGLDQVFPALKQYDGKWIVISSDYLKAIGDGYLQTTGNPLNRVTASDTANFLKATESVTRDYVFTTDPGKAVLVKKSFVGKENVDGMNTYHYKVALNAANTKAYCQAFDKAVYNTMLYKKLAAADPMADEEQQASTRECSDLASQVVKEYPSFDIWVDGHYKLLHKLRLFDPNNKQAYTDIGQDYRGGSELAFFVTYANSKSKTTGSFTFNTDTTTNVSRMALNIQSSSQKSPYEVNVQLQAKPQHALVTVTKPANPAAIQDVLHTLGLQPVATALTGRVTDEGAEAAINALAARLETTYEHTGDYPTLAQLNSSDWRAANMRGTSGTVLVPPNSKATTLGASATSDQFGYAPTNCDASGCQSYTLSALLSDGSLFTKKDDGSDDAIATFGTE